MRAAMLVGCAALLLSACSSEPVQQATAARHAGNAGGDERRRSGQLRHDRRLVIGGSSARWFGDWHVRAAERQTLQRAGAGGRQLRLLTAAPSRGSVSGTSTPASASGRRAYRPASGRRSPASTGFPSDRPAHPRAASCRSSHPGY